MVTGTSSVEEPAPEVADWLGTKPEHWWPLPPLPHLPFLPCAPEECPPEDCPVCPAPTPAPAPEPEDCPPAPAPEEYCAPFPGEFGNSNVSNFGVLFALKAKEDLVIDAFSYYEGYTSSPDTLATVELFETCGNYSDYNITTPPVEWNVIQNVTLTYTGVENAELPLPPLPAPIFMSADSTRSFFIRSTEKILMQADEFQNRYTEYDIARETDDMISYRGRLCDCSGGCECGPGGSDTSASYMGLISYCKGGNYTELSDGCGI